MLFTSYDPNDAQGFCPKCKRLCCDLYSEGGNLAYSPMYVDLSHPTCGARWRLFIDRRTNKIEIKEETT